MTPTNRCYASPSPKGGAVKKLASAAMKLPPGMTLYLGATVRDGLVFWKAAFHDGQQMLEVEGDFREAADAADELHVALLGEEKVPVLPVCAATAEVAHREAIFQAAALARDRGEGQLAGKIAAIPFDIELFSHK